MISEVSFSSFLASILLIRREISYSDMNYLMVKFENENNIDIIGECDDILSDLIICDDFEHSLRLRKNYNEYILNDEKMITVYDYLEDITNDFVRKFLSDNYSSVKSKERTKVLV